MTGSNAKMWNLSAQSIMGMDKLKKKNLELKHLPNKLLDVVIVT